MGKVDKHGQQNTLFVTLVGPVKQFEAYCRKFFANINLFIVLTIRQQTDKPIALPLAHAHGVIRL